MAGSSVPRDAVWHRRDVAAYWGVALSTLDDWIVKGHVRLPSRRRDPGGKPYWIAGEVIDGACAPELGAGLAQPVCEGEAVRQLDPPAPTMTDREAIAFLERVAARNRGATDASTSRL